MALKLNHVTYSHFLDTLHSLGKMSQHMSGAGLVPFADTAVADILPRVFASTTALAGSGRNLAFASEIGDNLPKVVVRAPTAADRARAQAMGVPGEMIGEGVWDFVKHAAHAVRHGAEWLGDKVAHAAHEVQHNPSVRAFEKKAADKALGIARGAVESVVDKIGDSVSPELAPFINKASSMGLNYLQNRAEGAVNSAIDRTGGSMMLPGAGVGYTPIGVGYSAPTNSYIPHFDRSKFHPNQLKRLP